MEQKCPICHKILKPLSQERKKELNYLPFCCERCKLIDLGLWLDSDYKIISTQQFQETDLISETPVSETNNY